MPRLTNSKTGVVVNVSDETATRLGSDWQAEQKPAPKKAPAKKSAGKSGNE